MSLSGWSNHCWIWIQQKGRLAPPTWWEPWGWQVESIHKSDFPVSDLQDALKNSHVWLGTCGICHEQSKLRVLLQMSNWMGAMVVMITLNLIYWSHIMSEWSMFSLYLEDVLSLRCWTNASIINFYATWITRRPPPLSHSFEIYGRKTLPGKATMNLFYCLHRVFYWTINKPETW